MTDLSRRIAVRNNSSTRHTSRRDAPVLCPCGRQVARHARQQRFCSTRCRQRAHYVEKVARGDFSARTVARPTDPPKKDNKSNALQRAKTLSSKRIFAPAFVLAVEIFDHPWKPAISSNGLPISIAPLRPRTLVGSP
jgi:hypothetical protein